MERSLTIKCILTWKCDRENFNVIDNNFLPEKKFSDCDVRINVSDILPVLLKECR